VNYAIYGPMGFVGKAHSLLMNNTLVIDFSEVAWLFCERRRFKSLRGFFFFVDFFSAVIW
jgi:hypothetical protein